MDKPPTTDIRLHETLPPTGVRKSSIIDPPTSLRDITQHISSSRNQQTSAMSKNTIVDIPTATSNSKSPSVGAGTFSLSQYRHDSLDVKAEVDRMYQNILRSLEGAGVNPTATTTVSQPTPTTSVFSHNHAIGGNSHDYFDYTTPKHHDNSVGKAVMTPSAPHYISATTDSRVAAMQVLLRNNKATSNLYRSNTFGSGRKGMSDPVTKIDTPGPGSYHSEGHERVRTSSARRSDSAHSMADAPRARSASATRVGVSFGKSERPESVLSCREVFASKRGPAMRPPGPGDYVAPSTFNNTKPTSTRGSFGKAGRDAGAPKPIAPGPGSYAISDLVDDKPTLHNKGPSPAFASQTPRLPPVKTVAPGPGAYSDQTLATKPVGHQGFSFGKAPLPIQAEPEVTPGPGDYYIEGEDANRLLKGVIPAAGRDDSAWGGKKLTENTPGPGTYTVKLEEKDGISMKFRYKEKTSEAPGPGQYNPDDQRQAGPSWSLSGKAPSKPIEITPGPGQYDDLPSTSEQKGITIGGGKRETPADIAAKENLPGPGFYETPTTLSPCAVTIGNAKRNNELDALSKRNVPGPGTYDTDTAEGLIEKRVAVPTLNGGGTRFPEVKAENMPPGPGHYHVDDASTLPAAIGGNISQAPRDTNWEGKDSTGVLGPGAYDNPITFNSGRAATIGLPIAAPAPENNPLVGPGAYYSSEALKALEPSAPSVTMGREGRFGVQPKDPLFPGPGTYESVNPDTWLYEKPPSTALPHAPRMPSLEKKGFEHLGPGSYMYEDNSTPQGGAIDAAARFPSDAKERARLGEVPGPGAYDIPTVGIDTSKAVTIGGTAHQPMGLQTEGPGPAAYFTNTSSLKEQGISFGSGPQRAMDAIDNQVPGPGAYATQHSAIDPHVSGPTINGRHETIKTEQQAGPGAYDPTMFHLPSAPSISLGGAARRFDLATNKDVPGPGWYDPAHEVTVTGISLSSGPQRFQTGHSTTPGPGTYDTAPFLDAMEAKGGVTFRGQGHSDLHSAVTDGPGPGAYDLRLPQATAITIHGADRAQLSQVPSGAKEIPGPGTYSLPSTLTAHAPSFGIGARPEPNPINSDTPGPGMYDPYLAMKLLHQASPAYSFSAAAKYGIPDSRTLNPGPGAYIIEHNDKQGPAYTFGKEERTKHQLAADTPGPGLYSPGLVTGGPAYSFPIAPRIVEEKQNEVPGPGAYMPLLQSNGPAITFGTDKGHDVYLRGEAVNVPGPGAYNISANGVLTGDEKAPSYSFGAASKLPPVVSSDQPGPGHYNPLLYAEGPFYSIAGKYPSHLEPRPDGPGPGAYELQSTLESNGKSILQAQRFPDSTNDQTPGPGTYMAIDTPNDGPKISFTVASRPKDTPNDAPGPGMYNQTLPPQGPWYSILGKPVDHVHNSGAPGPGTYDSSLAPNDRGAIMLGAKRFEQTGDEVPGPGMYTTHEQWNDGRAFSIGRAEKPTDMELREAANRPGPGQYTTALPPQGPFYSILGKGREDTNEDASAPGPGAYNLGALPKGPSALIGVAARAPSNPSDAVPGPGAYALPGALSPLGPTFGIAQRMPPLPNSDTPGPGMYDAGGAGMFDGPQYSFPLASNRPPAATDVPGPGMYDAGRGKDATMPQDSVYTFPRGKRYEHENTNRDNGPGAYNLGEAPHAGPAWSFAQGAPHGRGLGGTAAETPGPGSYHPQNLWDGTGPTIQGKWKDGGQSAGPGPGAYRVHDFDPYARDMATVIDFSKGGERVTNAKIKVVSSVGPGEYYHFERYTGTKQFPIFNRFPEKFVEPTPGPPDYHSPNVENPFYDPLSR